MINCTIHSLGENAACQIISLQNQQFWLQEIVDMERYIERVKKSISEKEPPLKVAETRLKKRTQAPYFS